MQGNLLKYINAIIPGLPNKIISAATHRQVLNLAALFNDFAASEYIMESLLATDNAEVDFSFRVLSEEKECLSNGLRSTDFSNLAVDETWRRVIDFVHYWPQDIADIWLEMDSSEYGKQIPQPCFFFNAQNVVKSRNIDPTLLFVSLLPLIGPDRLDSLKDNLVNVIQQLPSGAGLFQVGTMLARHRDRVRIFTAELNREQVVNYLSAIGWNGPWAHLDEIFNLVHDYSDGQYILDFDVTEQGVSEKIGINFGLKDKPTLSAFLDNLVLHQLCTAGKKEGVLNWSGSQGSFLGPDYGFTALIKDISHFKASLAPEEGIKVKAYLRFSGVYLKKMLAARNSQPSETEKTGQIDPGYKEIQNLIKEIARRAMLDQEFRQLCLDNSSAAIRKVNDSYAILPDIVFLEEDQKNTDYNGLVYVLPPYLKPSWLTSK